MSKSQIEYARKQGEYVINLDEALSSMKDDIKLQKVNMDIRKALNGGKNVVIDAAGTSKRELGAKYKGKQEELFEASKKVQNAIKRILEEVLINSEISGIMIFGGDTAINICENLGTRALRILGEIEPLVPYGVFVGGKMDGVFVATKAGGFGSENIIKSANDFFKNKGCLIIKELFDSNKKFENG